MRRGLGARRAESDADDQMAANILCLIELLLEPVPADVPCSWLPLSHDTGLIGMLLTPVYVSNGPGVPGTDMRAATDGGRLGDQAPRPDASSATPGGSSTGRLEWAQTRGSSGWSPGTPATGRCGPGLPSRPAAVAQR
jgi:hypothetical protein